jgi:DNA-3-methyladenine glycosylase II
MTIARIDLDLGHVIDLAASLGPYGRSGDDLLDRFDGTILVRSIRPTVDSSPIPYTARVPEAATDRLAVELPREHATHQTARAITATFVVDDEALVRLAAIDERIGDLRRRYPGLVPVLVTDPFHALIRSISAQQVNLHWAATLRARLATRYGSRLELPGEFVHFLDAAALADATVDELRGLQLTSAKARAAIATARASREGELALEYLTGLDDDALIAYLTRLPGIGRWSAEWFLARTLGRPRVVAGDLGVRKAVGDLYGTGLPSEADVRRLTAHWGDAAVFAQALALHHLAVSSSRAPAR